MKLDDRNIIPPEIDYDALLEPIAFRFDMTRRDFVQVLGAGVLVSVVAGPALAQRRGRGRGGFRGGPPPTIAARIHIGTDGTITVLSGKVDAGQGARTQIAMAAAEELRVPIDRVKVLLADTDLVPDDGGTSGSRTTPSTIPAVRQAAAAVRQMLVDHAATEWGVDAGAVEIRDGAAVGPQSDRTLSYAEFSQDEAFLERAMQAPPAGVELTPISQWQVLGRPPAASPVDRNKVTGRHDFPSDVRRPGMLYGAMLRAPTYRGKLVSVDVSPAEAMEGVVVVQDQDFVGVAAPTSFAARQAVEAIAKTAEWKPTSLPSSDDLYDYLRQEADVPANPAAEEMRAAAKSLRQTYHVAYVQHAPLEPRVAVAEWTGGKLSAWTGTQNPFRVKGELQQAFRLAADAVRVIIPDFGSGYGGKHTGEVAVEAARLAKAAGKPVMLRWTREEEFTWAYFRPAGVIDCEASLDAEHRITSWYHVNISSGGNSIEPPYDVGREHAEHVRSRPPLREGSYRALASTANSFARESFMDELAALAGVDPLEFRLAHLTDRRLRPVLEEAARQFNWHQRVKNKQPNRGVGLACSYDKGSVVAVCVEVEVERPQGKIHVRHVCEAFECGKVMNPDNVRSQVEGAVVMGLGPALSEEMRFDADGKIENASFRRYRVPHFKDTPKIDVVLVDRPDLPSVGAGETPIIVVAPAIANAVFHATGERIRGMPIRVQQSRDV
jgi:isoquinoline 1-oxidoreductase